MTADGTGAEVAAASGGTNLVIEVDVRDREAVEAMVARVVQEWGRLDVLVANAEAVVVGLWTPRPAPSEALDRAVRLMECWNPPHDVDRQPGSTSNGERAFSIAGPSMSVIAYSPYPGPLPSLAWPMIASSMSSRTSARRNSSWRRCRHECEGWSRLSANEGRTLPRPRMTGPIR